MVLNRIIIEIEDNGIGFGEESLKHVFEPFYTTKDENEYPFKTSIILT